MCRLTQQTTQQQQQQQRERVASTVRTKTIVHLLGSRHKHVLERINCSLCLEPFDNVLFQTCDHKRDVQLSGANSIDGRVGQFRLGTGSFEFVSSIVRLDQPFLSNRSWPTWHQQCGLCSNDEHDELYAFVCVQFAQCVQTNEEQWQIKRHLFDIVHR